ncbi:1-acyl-sn-glycerol-3-phosphate acyltransferase [Baekduia soli]|uniref:1-acyl-sn-glycerol-3-phosphate acyltransferase n=1 Tax=Baekduia soli TaxID=496014 RepID=A0A5B8U6F6_9ACTN|nr:lysophospholipid acyltransferase family protein [Baekduia soli]QEC48719.1 1-acyl-sn-glycerol-3-phosphate acyltransferase [Baekduia soli]
MSPRSERAAHRRARERGVSRALYRIVRALLAPPLRLWFRVGIEGAEHLPRHGPAILTPNHKSFLDPFFLSLAGPRPLRFMAKRELFAGPLGSLFVRLGAFPVRRGEADAEAMETARAVLRAGEVLVLFPEGTRVDEPDALGSPHHGAGRLATETGAPILPAAIAGTSRLWLGPLPRPRHVRVVILAPIRPGPGAADPVGLIDEQAWPEVREAYGRLRATPGVVVATLAALGIGAGFVARHRARPAPPRLLGVVAPRRLRRRERAIARLLRRLRR